ncbi:MAG: DUF4860 domain-containing protein [Coriobacteriia bacterium]|nr:DUF4860 domain-containing protein [Coriobacteriia bacterium]
MIGRRKYRERTTRLTRGKITNVGAPAIELKVSVDQEEQTNESFHIRHMDRLFILILFAVLIMSLVLVFALGTNAYRGLEQARTDGEQVRLQSSLLATSLRAMDAVDAAAKGQGPEGPALIMRERIGQDQFETRLYQYQGQLMQEYALAGTACDPARATALCPIKRFGFRIQDGLVTIGTDVGQTYVALRSQGGESS